MRRSRVPIAEKIVLESKTNHDSSQRKALPSVQEVMRKIFSVSMVNTRSGKESKTKVSAEEGRTVPSTEIDLETPDQSVDEVERKTTESTPMLNVEEQEKKTIEFSPIDIVDDTICNTPETIKDDSQTKRTSFTERIAMMVCKREGRNSTNDRERQDIWNGFCNNRDDDQVELVAIASHEAIFKSGTTANQEKTMAKLEKIDKN